MDCLQQCKKCKYGLEQRPLLDHAEIDTSSNKKAADGCRARCRARINLQPLSTLRHHLEQFDDPGFQPRLYNEDGYVPKGTLRTDGFALQLLVSN